MNKEKWRGKSASRLMPKLMEEVGEVAKEYVDVMDAPTSQPRLDAKLKMIGELDHVIFIAGCLKDVVQADIEAGRY